jgi:hypothetical protein
VPVRGVAALWHTRKQEAPLRLDSHGGAITLWFDSVLGDHYVCTYRLNGSLWSHGKVQQVSERPMPALGPQVVPSESPVRLHPDLMAVAS